MARRSKVPTNQCPQCHAPVVVLLVGKKYRACAAEAVAVIVPGQGRVTGWPVHRCAKAKPRRKAGTLLPGQEPVPVRTVATLTTGTPEADLMRQL